ncbi:phosphomannomutase [Devosia nitrariae]|uniref:Phosphomannomutase n=1 Tax=Devosia nitrariae TaxID=2071872 RepID=A0ABQ5W4I6_9HYPH|nr:phosphomannomutase [Devosia nitrariae]GLQ54958.1 phosphomannomutase [Devosia nitrariae]
MSETSLKFGTSGLRGLATELNGPPAYRYTRAFLEVLIDRGTVSAGSHVALGRDLRSSSPGIAGRVAAAVADLDLRAIDCGALPTPALSLFAAARGIPAIMITGSHIPDDRNGLKFYSPAGEIDKRDEAAITERVCRVPASSAVASSSTEADQTALEDYKARYLDFLPGEPLAGLRIGVYQHSSVARDLLFDVLCHLGADAHRLGRSETFIPVDTEALRPQDVASLERWARVDRFDAIVSTDGDADRPLIADENGRFVRGDLVGAITSHWLAAAAIVVPVTANSALEQGGRFAQVVRTRVGSPYVIEGMATARRQTQGCVVGFEANGGVLLATQAHRQGRTLAPLPTRDALLPILACLATVAKRGMPLSAIAAEFGFRDARSDRLTEVAPEVSTIFLDDVSQSEELDGIGRVTDVDTTDGVRLTLAQGEIIHYRASGNAPELRCYVEAEAAERTAELLAIGLGFAADRTKAIEKR